MPLTDMFVQADRQNGVASCNSLCRSFSLRNAFYQLVVDRCHSSGTATPAGVNCRVAREMNLSACISVLMHTAWFGLMLVAMTLCCNLKNYAQL